MQLTARQATLIHGWLNPRPFLTWDDVKEKKLQLPKLIALGLRARDLATMQPDPREWALHAGATAEHARFMTPWPANPLTDLGGGVLDLIEMKPTAAELQVMGVTYAQLRQAGMVERLQAMFRFSEEEWEVLGYKRNRSYVR